MAEQAPQVVVVPGHRAAALIVGVSGRGLEQHQLLDRGANGLDHVDGDRCLFLERPDAEFVGMLGEDAGER